MGVQLVTQHVLDKLIEGISKAQSIYILTSFVMHSGIRLLQPYLRSAITRGAEVKVLVGDYLFVTQPEGLRELIATDELVEARLWRSNGVSFHPKSYMFQYGTDDGMLIVGSSNLSRSALTHGIEWNLAMEANVSFPTFEEAQIEFMKLFYHEQTVPINNETCRQYEQEYEDYHQAHPQLARTWTSNEEMDMMFSLESAGDDGALVLRESPAVYDAISPRPAQKMALDELEKTWEEGYNRAMVVMATGLGKTYLAAFFAQRFQKVLFIAHREELLLQAARSFQTVMPNRSTGVYDGKNKERSADSVFASIYTLSMNKHLESFNKNEFDLIIMDEFHHAAAHSYQRVLDYFLPEFLLGITATPFRADGKDVYAICDGNVAFQLDFIEAIRHQWLAPFHYYGIHDETDYSKITWTGTRYDEEELLLEQIKEEVAENIYRAWCQYKQTRTLAFCSSIRQANFLAHYFQQKGIRAISLHSNTKEMTRSEVIEQIESGSLEIVFTVDLFNEGTDIPSLDTLLFVRPTESLTVFTQQVGRGLRLYPSKTHCTIIDLIGNYRNADVKLSLFSLNEREQRTERFQVPVVPADCHLELELGVINLLQEMSSKKHVRKDRLLLAFEAVKQELGRVPTYLELHLHGRENSREYRQEFKSYAHFLGWANQLTANENEIMRHYGDWLMEVEGTGMTKSYKMVVLLYMLERGERDWYKPVSPQEVAPFFHAFFIEKEYRKNIDFADKSARSMWDYQEAKVSRLIAEMPMTKWSGSSKGLVGFQNNQFSLSFDVDPAFNDTLYRWTKEICLYRLHAYFERKAT
ncbi:MAG: DEAD/DEAH box helicase family protein [Clostridia bacterium]